MTAFLVGVGLAAAARGAWGRAAAAWGAAAAIVLGGPFLLGLEVHAGLWALYGRVLGWR